MRSASVISSEARDLRDSSTEFLKISPTPKPSAKGGRNDKMLLLGMTWESWRRWIPAFAGMTIVALFFAFQVHQLLSFNPYWGYDGGAHVQILETLLVEYRFPTLAENYLAWHEPLYYLVLVGFGLIGIPFWFPHLLIVLAIDVLVFALFKRMGLSNVVSLFGSIAILSLPAFLEVSMFFTNEALNYVFVLAIMHLGFTFWREQSWSWKSSLLFAICVGLGVVTKITALVAFGVVVILLVIKIGRILTDKTDRKTDGTDARKGIWKYGVTVAFAVLFAGLCYAPWYTVRSGGLSRASINNYDMLPAKELVWDERVGFMTTFDTDIFTFPFWYSGGMGFWSMVYADTVSDYLGLFENQDLKNALPESERTLTTHNGTSVSAYREPLAEWALRLGLLPVGVILIGIVSSFFVILREVKSRPKDLSDALPVLGFSSAFLLALMYYAYRYPYYDQGVVKSIFIAPVFVLPMAIGLRYCGRLPKWVLGIGAFVWVVYIVVVLSLFFVRT